jgi:uncharacterized protein YabE (DUF348 family)
MTYKDTVKDLLQESPVKPDGNDRLEGAGLEDGISDGMELRIVRVTEKVVEETESIPYAVQRKASKRLDEGTEKVVQPGQEGMLEKLYKVVKEDGKEVSKQFLMRRFSEPINMIMSSGTVLEPYTSRGDVVRYKKVLDMKATAYTARSRHREGAGHPSSGSQQQE